LGSKWEDLNSNLKKWWEHSHYPMTRDRNPFCTGETQLEKAFGLFMRFTSIYLNVSKPLGYLCVGGYGLGNLSLETLFIKINVLNYPMGIIQHIYP
jgi:hypothetical protein